MILSKCYT